MQARVRKVALPETKLPPTKTLDQGECSMESKIMETKMMDAIPKELMAEEVRNAMESLRYLMEEVEGDEIVVNYTAMDAVFTISSDGNPTVSFRVMG